MIFRLTLFLCLNVVAFCDCNASAIGRKEILRGYLVDLVCVKEEASRLSNLGATHTRKCLQMPVCNQGGYALLLPSNEVLAFDNRGNELARKLIAAGRQERSIIIKATGIREGSTFHVLRME